MSESGPTIIREEAVAWWLKQIVHWQNDDSLSSLCEQQQSLLSLADFLRKLSNRLMQLVSVFPTHFHVLEAVTTLTVPYITCLEDDGEYCRTAIAGRNP